MKATTPHSSGPAPDEDPHFNRLWSERAALMEWMKATPAADRTAEDSKKFDEDMMRIDSQFCRSNCKNAHAYAGALMLNLETLLDGFMLEGIVYDPTKPFEGFFEDNPAPIVAGLAQIRPKLERFSSR